MEEAIEIYLGTTGVISTYYNFLQPSQLNRNAKGKVLFKYLKTLNSADMKFYSDSRIEMEIALAAPKPLEKVKLRFEVRYQNGITSGTSFLDKPFNLLEGDNTVTLHFDTTHFVAGKYYVDLVAYIYNQFGNEEYLNGIYPGFAFEIIEDINENNELVWLPQYWGSVHLHDTVLVK